MLIWYGGELLVCGDFNAINITRGAIEVWCVFVCRFHVQTRDGGVNVRPATIQIWDDTGCRGQGPLHPSHLWHARPGPYWATEAGVIDPRPGWPNGTSCCDRPPSRAAQKGSNLCDSSDIQQHQKAYFTSNTFFTMSLAIKFTDPRSLVKRLGGGRW